MSHFKVNMLSRQIKRRVSTLIRHVSLIIPCILALFYAAFNVTKRSDYIPGSESRCTDTTPRKLYLIVTIINGYEF